MLPSVVWARPVRAVVPPCPPASQGPPQAGRDQRQHQRQAEHRRAQSGNNLAAPGLPNEVDAADDQQQPRDVIEWRIAVGQDGQIEQHAKEHHHGVAADEPSQARWLANWQSWLQWRYQPMGGMGARRDERCAALNAEARVGGTGALTIWAADQYLVHHSSPTY
jgi:hypothetical protein